MFDENCSLEKYGRCHLPASLIERPFKILTSVPSNKSSQDTREGLNYLFCSRQCSKLPFFFLISRRFYELVGLRLR